MPTPRTTRRAVAEINFGEGQAIRFTAGNRSIHQFWHLFSSHFRHVLLAPQRRPDSGRVAWTWREAVDNQPVTATELAEVRRRLSEANRSLAGGFSGLDSDEEGPAGALDRQVRMAVGEIVEELVAQRDFVFAKFVCRTDAGLMVHSWGASVAAEPFYPDAQSGEISGVVIAGAGRLAGVSVALESAQGASVARVTSEADGSFRFANVAPGSYRIRVLDRSDFPADGLSVAMERESITGLELRGTAVEPPAPAGASAAVDAAPPWYRRRLTLLLALLLLVGVGSCVWNSSRSTEAKSTSGTKHSTGWQSANGQLAGGVSTNEPVDSRKVGNDGASTSLKSSTPLPKISVPRQSGSQTAGAGSGDRTSSQSDGGTLTDSRTTEERPTKQDSVEKVAAPTAKTPQAKPADRSAAESTRSKEGEPATEEPAENAPTGKEAKPADAKLAKSSTGALDKKRPSALGAAVASTDELPPEAALSPGGESAVDPAASSPTGGTNVGKKSTKPQSKPGASGATAASAASAENEATAQEPSTSAATANAPGQLNASPGQKKNEKTGGLSGSPEVASPSDQLAAAAATEAPPDSTESAPAEGKASPTSPPPKKSAAAPTSSSAEPSPGPVEENSAPDATSAANTSAKKKPTPPIPAPAGKNTSTAKAASDSAAEPSSSEENASTSEPASTASGKSAPKAKAKSLAQKPAAPATGESQPAESQSASAAEAIELSTSRAAAGDGGSLTQIARVRATAWKARLVQDLILPTRPVTAAEEEALEEMRKKILSERAARMPAAFRQPRVTSGFSVEYPDAKNPPRWRDEAGVEIAGAAVNGNRAELSWSGTILPRDKTFVLRSAGGSELARVTADQAGVPLLKVAPAARASYWVEIGDAPAVSGFDWRLLSGAAIPVSWKRAGARVDIPLDATTARVGNYGVALVDPKSGWALASDIALH